MSKTQKQPKRAAHRPMPEDPRELAQAMFRYGDKKMKEKRAAENPAARVRPVTPHQTTASR